MASVEVSMPAGWEGLAPPLGGAEASADQYACHAARLARARALPADRLQQLREKFRALGRRRHALFRVHFADPHLEGVKLDVRQHVAPRVCAGRAGA